MIVRIRDTISLIIGLRVAYKDYIQKKYQPPNDYYKFLEELPYATDPQYINKVKRIVND